MSNIFKILFLISFLWSCQNSQEAQGLIDAHFEAIGDYSDVETLITKASGTSPEGDYYTVTESSLKDNYLLFLQNYDFKSSFNAVIYDWKKGQGLDTTLTKQGALSTAVIAVLKAHEFHEIVLQPEDRFSAMSIVEDTTFFRKKCSQVITSDHLGLPTRVFFEKSTNLLIGFSVVNPYRKGEVIKVHFDDWNEIDGRNMFRTVTIEQGENSSYHLDYEETIYNDPNFSKLD